MKFNIKKNSIVVSWLSSYFFILLIPIVVSSIIYMVSQSTIQKEIITANESMLKQIQQVVDNQLDEIEVLTLNISMNSKIQSLLYWDNIRVSSSGYDIFEIVKSLKLVNVTCNFASDFFVYFKKTDIILGPDGKFEPRHMFDVVQQYKDITYEQWHYFLNGYHYKDIELMEKNVAVNETETNRVITYVHSLPYQDPKQSMATVVVTLNEKLLQELIKNTQWVEGGDLLILDCNNQVVIFTGYSELPDDIYNDLLKGESGLFNERINEEKKVISYITSSKYKWKYVSIIPEKIFMNKARYINQMATIGIGICFFIGAFVSYFFFKKNYNPVNELVNMLSKGTSISVDKELNEYQFIHKAISRTLVETDIIKENLLKQKTVLRSNFIMKLLKGRMNDTESIQEILHSFDMNFISCDYAVLMFYIEDFSGLFLEGKDKSPDEKWKLVQFIISNIVEELANQNFVGFSSEVDEIVFCLVNIIPSKEIDTNRELLRIAEETRKYISKNFSIYLTVGISDIHHNYVGIAEAYQEVIKTMQYKIIVGDYRSICYNEIKNPQQTYDYSLECEYQILNFIKVGDYENTRQILNQVFDKNFSGDILSIEMARCLLFDLASTIIKALNSINAADNKVFFNGLYPVESIMSCKTVQDMREGMELILQKTCEFIQKNKKSHNSELCEKIISFIKKNYHDMNLNISQIAEQFDINPVYMSRLYKEQTGEGLLDFIKKLRLKKAKKLLGERDLNISDIAAKVGYYNSNALIRAFKKYEGITPGQYKEMNDCMIKDIHE